jgi:hypothetical protein
MKSTALFLSLALLTLPAALGAQNIGPDRLAAHPSNPHGASGQSVSPIKNPPPPLKPFSRLAVEVGVSTLGVNLQVATNLDKHINLRATGNVVQYDVNNISTNGFNVDAKLNLATAGASVDFYPFANHGLRFSPGVLFLNQNAASAAFSVAGGTTFTLDNVTYYASTSNPVTGAGDLALHSQNPAFTLTAGWGNVIPRKGGHLSFPVELGVAFIGAPALNIALTSGQVCDANGQNCVDVATDQSVQSNLQAQIAKYKSDLDPLKTYPIASFGVAYSFHVR